MQDKKEPFDENNINFVKKGVKITNENSSIKKEDRVKEVDFRQRVSEIINEEEEQKKIAYDLIKKYMTAIKSKKLDETKDLKVRESEQKIIKDLIDFSRIVNSNPDENQEDNVGTMFLLTFVLRCLYIQRDRINELEYECNKLRKEIQKKNDQNPPTQ